MKEPVTCLDYRQYPLVSQINYTLINFAHHCQTFSAAQKAGSLIWKIEQSHGEGKQVTGLGANVARRAYSAITSAALCLYG